MPKHASLEPFSWITIPTMVLENPWTLDDAFGYRTVHVRFHAWFRELSLFTK